jgi:DNA-directed RNA polymerase subunit alpha
MKNETLLSECDLSVRLKNLFKVNNIITIGDLLKLDTCDLIKYRNFGKRSVIEIQDFFWQQLKIKQNE